MSVRYVSQKIRDQVRLDRFREALSGAHRSSGPSETLHDFGVTKPVEKDDISDLTHIFGAHIHRENMEEESVVTGTPVPEDEPGPKQPSILVRMLSSDRSERASRAETVMSRTSSSVSYETPEHPHRETQVSLSFHDKAMNKANNADPLIRDVNAVQMLMENIFDWDFHERHHGDTLTRADLLRLAKSLRSNMKATCPSVPNIQVIDLFAELAENKWLGDVLNIKHVTQSIIEAYLDAQNGNPAPLEKAQRLFQGSIRYHERFYAALAGDGKVPLRTLAAVLERQGNRPMVASRS